ncbi:MAG: hypothetical protein IJB97_08730, partial [Clostridia bacterium]|nr:hypothetical protein [Clostridia bacterium]
MTTKIICKKKIIPLLLAVGVFATFCVSCSDKNKGETLPVSVVESIEKTDIDLVKNGETEYSIVVPFNANDYETYAAQELELYFESASGADVVTVKDSDVTYDTQKKYLSVGKTTFLQRSGVAVDYQELGEDGYKIVRKDNTVIMAGGGDYGTLYAVYEFLHHAFGFEPYAIDEIYYDIGLNFKLPDFNLTDVPAVAARAGCWYYNYHDASFAAKWRTYKGIEYKMFNERAWYYFPHAHFKLLNPATYLEDHPDWYAASQKQLCLSSEGAYQQFLFNLKKLISENPKLLYIPLGGED